MSKYISLFLMSVVMVAFALPSFVDAAEDVAAESVESVVQINDSTGPSIIGKDGVVVVDFYSDWCPPCKKLAPIYAQVAKEMAGQATFAKANLNNNKKNFDKYKVTAMPTLILFKNGKEVNRRTGFCDAAALKAFVKSAS